MENKSLKKLYSNEVIDQQKSLQNFRRSLIVSQRNKFDSTYLWFSGINQLAQKKNVETNTARNCQKTSQALG